jgi:hypothetical protein
MNHDQTTAELRKRIGQTSALLNQCAAQDKAIATGATARFKQVQARMDVVRKTAMTDPKRWISCQSDCERIWSQAVETAPALV